MTLVVHLGDSEKSIFDGLPWEIHSKAHMLMLFSPHGDECGRIPIKDIHDPTDTSTAYHIWTDATEWIR